MEYIFTPWRLFLVEKISGTQTMKYALCSGISSLQSSQQLAIISCSEPEKSRPQPPTLLTEKSSGAFANQSLKATASLVMLIRSSLGLSAVNKAIQTEGTYLNFVFGKCTDICRHITILLKMGKVPEILDVDLKVF